MKNKGFTLIELLAVILILGIIALIAIPIVTTMISSAKKSALESSLYGIADAASKYIVSSELTNVQLTSGTTYDSSVLSYKGSIDKGKFIFNSNNDVTVLIVKGNLCGYMDYAGNTEIGTVSSNYCVLKNTSIDLSFGVALAGGYVTSNGALKVSGNKLLNASGDTFQLRGVATESFGSFADNKVTMDTIASLKSWGANCIRVQVNPTSTWFPTYQYIGNEANTLTKLYSIIDSLIAMDLYVIVDWHNYDMATYQTNSLQFLSTVSSHYGNNKYILYEIANEPVETWSDIKTYSSPLIAAIRTNAPNSVIIVPAGTQSGHPEQVTGSMMSESNILYGYHNYVLDSVLQDMINAIDNGVPLIVTEWAAARYSDGTSIYKENVATKFIDLMNDNAVSWTYFCITSANAGVYTYRMVDTWGTSLENSTLTQSGSFVKNVLKNNGISPYTAPNIMKVYDATYAFWTDTYKTKITSVIVDNVIDTNAVKNAVISWDMSIVNLNDVIAYLVDDGLGNGTYVLHLAGNGGVALPSLGSNIFTGMTSLKTVNLAYLDTTLTTNFSNMFLNCTSLTSADLSSFKFDIAIKTANMFQNCTSITTITFPSTINTAQVTNFGYMFSGCTKLATITNVEKFNTSNGVYLYGMFGSCKALTTLNLSTYDTSKNTNTSYMFGYDSALTYLDISSFTFTNVTTTTSMLVSIPVGATIYVKDATAKTFLQTIRSDLTYTIK